MVQDSEHQGMPACMRWLKSQMDLYFLEDQSIHWETRVPFTFNSLTHALDKYQLSTYNGTMLGAREIGVNKIGMIPTLMVSQPRSGDGK